MKNSEIIKQREDFARMMCARETFINENPHCETILITQNDLDKVSDIDLRKMVKIIEPPKAMMQKMLALAGL